MRLRRAFGSIAAIALLGTAPDPARIGVTVDRGQAETALAILDTLAAGKAPSDAEWRAAFGARGFQRLKAREESLGRSFTEADFKAYLLAPETRAKTAALHRALAAWSVDRSGRAAAKALAYLPAGTVLRATVYPTIKPKPNQFVFDLARDPSIFLVLDPPASPAKAANTMAHELHHIGFGAACSKRSGDATAPGVAMLRAWIGGFGEGLAMLAAAGGPKVHPHAVSDAAERAEWDRNAARFAEQMREQDGVFRSVVAGTAGDAQAVEARMRGYFGVQGPWYTVGWRMAQVIETELGRGATIAAFCDSRRLLATYNRAAARHNRRAAQSLPLWDAELAAALAAH